MKPLIRIVSLLGVIAAHDALAQAEAENPPLPTLSAEATATPQPIEPPVVPPPPANPAAAAAPSASPATPEAPRQNPFQYRVPSEGGFVPAATEKIPNGIKILGIMIKRSGIKLAVLQIPGMSDVVYVRENDVFGVQRVALQKGGTETPKGSLLYLKIDKITNQQVELHPEQNPAGREILR